MTDVLTLFNGGVATRRLAGSLPRGWAINDGDQSKLAIPEPLHVADVAIGTLVYCGHDQLPDWAGIVDTPWVAKEPAQATVYDVAYALSRRCPETARDYTGTTATIIEQLIAAFEDQGAVGFRMGETDTDPAQTIALDQRSFWQLIQEMAKNAGMEMRIRPAVGASGLELYLDLKKRLGADTGYRLHDGEHGNMTVNDAKIQEEIWTRVIAIGDQSSKSSRLTVTVENAEASRRYGRRTTTVQFSGISELSALSSAAEAWLAQNSGAWLTLTVSAMENDVHTDTYRYLELGNRLLVHASRVILPGGVSGWRGMMRIRAMEVDAKGYVNMTMRSEEAL